ncbi:MAG: Ig-like domain-containing protein [Bacteroidales bacterium]|nr:Ig-like domain-containing protein [Bacteroidales bacterium]
MFRVSTLLKITAIMLMQFIFTDEIKGQDADYEFITINTDSIYQQIAGFGGSLAYYEGWVTAHPNKAGIYEAIFKELSLDILRIRNAYAYDASMIEKVSEFNVAAENQLGKPIDILVTSWGPPAYLKSNNDRKNGGTLKYAVENNNVKFDYAGFAHWWNNSLNAYESNGIYPTYISIQNEPDFTATWESCLLRPTEIIGVSDTIAGYDSALGAVYDTISKRTYVPRILGPEPVGIGYNAVQNYINELDINKLHGIAHHLYHGVDVNNPYASEDFRIVGELKPEIPHYQTEFSGGDWWSLAGLIFKSLNDENAVAYLYWDLAWPGAGLVDIDNPWTRSSWQNTDGYARTKDFYVFKQFSAFIHPGWTRFAISYNRQESKMLGFINPAKDSVALVMINLSESNKVLTPLNIPGFRIDSAEVFYTSESMNCQSAGKLQNMILETGPKTIATVQMIISESSSDALIEEIQLQPADTIIDSRLDSLDLNPQIVPENASNKTLFWQITKGDTIAAISQSGMLKALGTHDGIAGVKATAVDGSGVFATREISVINQVLVESIEIKASAGRINTPEGTIQYTVTVYPDQAFNMDLVWEIISGTDIATLSQEGLLTALGTGDGQVTIRVSTTDGSGVFEEFTVNISNQIPVTSVTISSFTTTIDEFMGSLQLHASVLPENASDTTVAWSVEQNDTLAKIDQSGLLHATGIANGFVYVIATANDASGLSDQLEIEITGQDNSALFPFGSDMKFDIFKHALRYKIPQRHIPGILRIYSTAGKLLYQEKIEPGQTSGNIFLEPNGREILLLEYTDFSEQVTIPLIMTGG